MQHLESADDSLDSRGWASDGGRVGAEGIHRRVDDDAPTVNHEHVLEQRGHLVDQVC